MNDFINRIRGLPSNPFLRKIFGSNEIDIENVPQETPTPTPIPTITPKPRRKEYNIPKDQENKTIATFLAEAIAEGKEGLHGVMSAADNRLGTPSLYGGTRANIFDVISEPKQFSGFSKTHRIYTKFRDYLRGKDVKLDDKEKEALNLAIELFSKLSTGELEDITGGANHYYNPALAAPNWANKLQNIKKIGSHVFGRL